jgi:hypothetical protein
MEFPSEFHKNQNLKTIKAVRKLKFEDANASIILINSLN